MFHDLVSDHAIYNIRMGTAQGIYGPVLDFNNQLFVALLLLVGGWQVLYRGLEPAVLLQFWAMTGSFFGPIQNIGNQYNAALTSMAGAERVFNLLDTRPDFGDPPTAVELNGYRGKVEFRNLSFGYLPDKPVLHDVNFRVEPGQTIALVGHTGSGKTTIINLVSKFYLPSSGEIQSRPLTVRFRR